MTELIAFVIGWLFTALCVSVRQRQARERVRRVQSASPFQTRFDLNKGEQAAFDA